ncbi:zinc-finger domain-containing protein [Geminicoccus flavidas]|uniref:zinc-finger domain-containing protein n=1 Tax=Geminicoccus flavidas TaxID=2506407 RepID=UPI001F22D024|nr:zinc-finger domain-containing protein [Geminicoccus flavidas]
MADLFLNVDGREVVITDKLYVRCDGGEGPLGHPVEYMTLEKGGETVCKYCSRRYVHTSAPAAQALHSDPRPATA